MAAPAIKAEATTLSWIILNVGGYRPGRIVLGREEETRETGFATKSKLQRGGRSARSRGLAFYLGCSLAGIDWCGGCTLALPISPMYLR